MKSIMFKGLILLVVMIPVLTGCSRKTVAPVVVPVPYEVKVEVEKKLNWWQKLTMWLGSIAIVGGIAIGGYKLWVKLR